MAKPSQPMPASGPPSQGTRNRRAYVRHAVRLAAILLGPTGQRRPCEIRDFCPGGLLLAYPRTHGPQAWVPEPGETIRVVSTVDTDGASQPVRMVARVVRADRDSAGVAFLATERAGIELLSRHVANAPSPGEQSANPPGGAMSANGARILAESRDRVLDAAGRLAVDLEANLAAALSEATGPGPERAELRLAAQALATPAGRLRETFERHLRGCIDELLTRTGEPQDVRGGQDRSPLALVDEGTFSRWLAVTALADHIETRANGALVELEQRLGHLLARPVGRADDPFSPQQFALAYLEALDTLAFPSGVLERCHAAVRDAMTAHLCALYSDLNGYLEKCGIVVTIAIKKVSSPRHSSPGRSTMKGGTPARRPVDAGAGARNDSGRASADVPSGGIPDVGQFSHVIQALMSLASAIPTSGTPHPGAAAPISPDELAARMFRSVMDDVVAPGVATWLARLEEPLRKLALRDPGLLADRSHAARRLVNKVAQLDDACGGVGGESDAIQRELSGLVDRITRTPDMDAGVLESVLKRLNTLTAIQEQAFSDNLREVIAACEARQADAYDPPAVDLEDGDAEELIWGRRARRLRPGDWVGLTGPAGESSRLRLAWVSPGGGRFVFVDGRGLHALEIDHAELAGRLREGGLTPLGEAGEPALDRVQYRMLQQLQRELVRATTHDGLTGLLNRREFDRQIISILADDSLAVRSTLCYFDITQFGVVNTTCGYEAGDRLLREVANILVRGMGEGAVLARLGSDEFAAVVPQPIAGTQSIASALLAGFSDYRFAWNGEHGETERLAISVSMGIVGLDGVDNAPAALQAAEAACREAARSGTNQIRLSRAGDEGRSGARRTRRWLSRIDRAIDRGDLELSCQRIVATGGEHACATAHCEILIALSDEAGQPVSPQEFIIAAELHHRMPAVDRWVVSNTFAFMTRHADLVSQLGGFAINLSGRSISDPSFRAFLLGEAASTGVQMERVCFEITETAGIDSLSDASDFINEMKETGCQFSLDDFGSGLSSYAYLKNLPVDFLKIDGAFVVGMDRNPTDCAVVRSIVEIGHFMQKKIIAERVENERVLAILREIGVDYAQGFHIERPRLLSALSVNPG